MYSVLKTMFIFFLQFVCIYIDKNRLLYDIFLKQIIRQSRFLEVLKIVKKIPRTHCGIIIVRGGLMFVDFVGYPYPRIYVPTNV